MYQLKYELSKDNTINVIFSSHKYGIFEVPTVLYMNQLSINYKSFVYIVDDNTTIPLIISEYCINKGFTLILVSRRIINSDLHNLVNSSNNIMVDNSQTGNKYSEIITHVRSTYNDKDYFKIIIDINNTVFSRLLYTYLYKELSNISVRGPNIVWIPETTGLILRALVNIWPETTLKVVIIESIYDTEKYSYGVDMTHVEEHISKYEPNVNPILRPPYNCINTYDGKVWERTRILGKDKDYILVTSTIIS